MKVRFGELELDAEAGETLLAVAQRSGVPLGTHCGGVCACSKCHVYVAAPEGSVSPMAQDEDDMLELAARDRRPRSRLGCQVRILEKASDSRGLGAAGSALVAVTLSEESFEAYLEDHPGDRGSLIARWSPR